MINKSSLVSFAFGLLVLFAIVLQSAHSFVHLEKELAQKQCIHNEAKNQSQFTHAHHNLEHCFVCEFAFSTSIKSDSFSFTFKKVVVPVWYSYFYSKEIAQSFRGSLFALRAPPSYIV
ncbi:hypothetical protein [Flavobacterium sp.]|uniref:hypothetical protein n=1 Tax=Flavobacterium sp. TaxID=239 RepID=UPI003BE1309F